MTTLQTINKGKQFWSENKSKIVVLGVVAVLIGMAVHEEKKNPSSGDIDAPLEGVKKKSPRKKTIEIAI